MKKYLSILLIIALTCALFAGCNDTTDQPSGDPTPTPIELGDKGRPSYDGNIIEFNLYNEGDFQTRWTDASKEWMLEKYQLKIASTIPGASGGETLLTQAGRLAYNEAIYAQFLTSEVPDYMPAVYGSATGADVVFKSIGPDYLVDFNPFLEEGCILEDYVKWLWGTGNGLWEDGTEYWEKSKAVLEVNDALYGLPRREIMPAQNFLGYSTVALEAINVDWEDLPTTWQGFVDLLTAFKQRATSNIGFVSLEGRADLLLQFIATTYGLDFNADFRWTEKNGEPLWTYYWEEYLHILENVKDLAAKDLVMKNTTKGNNVVHNYDLDYSSALFRANKGIARQKAEQGLAIASYTTTTWFGIWASYGGKGVTDWEISDKMIAQDGYEASVIGTSYFDGQIQEFNMGGYVCIGKRLGREFSLRVMDMMSYSLTDEGYLAYFFGREGSPFADTLEEAGNIVFDENGKIRCWLDDRLGWRENKDFWVEQDARAAALDDLNGVMVTEEFILQDRASEYGITGTGFWPSVFNYRLGMSWVADVSAFPMRLTAYWEREQMSFDEARINAQIATARSTNSEIFAGLYMTPTEKLGSTTAAVDIEQKISNLQALAKNFTIDFLGNDKTASAWDAYIKDLQDGGYADVFNYYKYATPDGVFITTQSDSVTRTQSNVDERRSS